MCVSGATTNLFTCSNCAHTISAFYDLVDTHVFSSNVYKLFLTKKQNTNFINVAILVSTKNTCTRPNYCLIELLDDPQLVGQYIYSSV